MEKAYTVAPPKTGTKQCPKGKSDESNTKRKVVILERSDHWCPTRFNVGTTDVSAVFVDDAKVQRKITNVN